MIGLTLCRRAGLAAGAIALTAVSGCSLAFVDAPPRDHASRHFFDCTTSMLAPGLDATTAGIMALGVVGAVSDGSHDSTSVVDGTLVAAAALASATYGYLRVSRCRDAKEKLGERLLDMPYLGVPPPGLPGAPQPLAGAAGSTPAPAPATGVPATAAAGRDPWLSEGPPPPPTYPRRAPTLMPPPPPYLRLAPQDMSPSPQPPAVIAPPAPPPTSPATAPPPAATPAPKPAPTLEMPPPADGGSRP